MMVRWYHLGAASAVALVACQDLIVIERTGDHSSGGGPAGGAAEVGGDPTDPRKTCDDVGQGYGDESCCNEKYCNGECVVVSVNQKACGCVGQTVECPSNTICCPLLGCSSIVTCNAHHGEGGA